MRRCATPATGQFHSSPHKAWLLLKLSTDAGIDGWGDGTGEWLVDVGRRDTSSETDDRRG